MNAIAFLIRLIADRNTTERIEQETGRPLRIGDLGKVLRGHFQRFTIYNPLALVAGMVFFATLIYPWWYAVMYNDLYTVQAFPFILKHSVPLDLGASYIIETPPVAVVFLLCLLAVYALILFWGSTLSGVKGALYVAVAGLCMLLYTAGFYGSIWYAADHVGMPMTGYSWIFHEVQIDIRMAFTREYSIAIGAGATCLILSLIHGLLPIRFYRRGRRDT